MQSYQCEAMPCQLKATIVMRHPDIYKHGYQRVAEDSKTLRLKVFTKRLPNFWWKAFSIENFLEFEKGESPHNSKPAQRLPLCGSKQRWLASYIAAANHCKLHCHYTAVCIAVHCGTFPYIAVYCQSPSGSLLTDNKPNRLN